MSSKEITIHTDGSARPNPGKASFCAVLQYGDYRKEIIQKYKLSTNSRMELMSVVIALESLKVTDWNITIYSDSKYVIDSVEKGWVFNWQKTNFSGRINSDLWKRLLICYKLNNIKFIWVKGHADNELNNYCDIMATKKTNDNTEFLIDYGYDANK